jgi:1-phosphofructokinase family hexose kinase
VKPIVVVALNPSIDAEWRVADVVWEEKNNVQSETRWAGGKGVNVTRWLQHLGCDSRLMVPLGGRIGDELASHLRAEKILPHRIPIHQETRVNVIVTTAAGRQIRFNPLGPKLSADERLKIFYAVENQIKRAGLLILSGSLPQGLPDDSYAKLIRLAHRHGVKTLLDCDGAPFAAAVAAKPFLVKPNEHELAAWFGRSLRSEREIVAAATKLSARTRGWVLVSCGGSRSHLVNFNEGIALSAHPKKVRPRNTVGAGDALLAGAAREIMRGNSPLRWLQRGLATGTAATQLQAGKLPASRPR